MESLSAVLPYAGPPYLSELQQPLPYNQHSTIWNAQDSTIWNAQYSTIWNTPHEHEIR